jgi:AcrR family transcriptional regulator
MSMGQRGHVKVTAMARLRDDHVEATRRALLAAARRRFGTQGYGATSLDDVAADAGVTKGALYHHFRGKEHLFLAVYDEVEGDLSAHGMAAAAQGSDPVDALKRGFGAFLDLALDPVVQRIALLDAPSVLGTAAKLEVDARHSLAAVRLAVEMAIAEGLLAPLDPDALASLLIAACSQAALLIATADDPTAARPRVGAALDRLITGLVPPEPT